MRPGSRRHFLAAGVGALSATSVLQNFSAQAARNRIIRLSEIELLPVRATERTVWLFVRLKTNTGLHGLGEASDAFGYFDTTREQAQTMLDCLRSTFELVKGRTPFDVGHLRAAGEPQSATAAQQLVRATAFSAIEQAMWDLAGQITGLPVSQLLGGSLRDRLPVYANINRATKPRTPDGFASSATKAVAEGFRALKLAPFDGFKREAFSNPARSSPVAWGIDCVAAVRQAVGNDVKMMIDAHSLFDVPLGIKVAEQLYPYRLEWYEEPVAPELITETCSIRRAIKTPMAAGETLYRMPGFDGLCRNQAVQTIMPDVKHCGGLLEMTHIAALADMSGIDIAPHNPSGPVSTAATAQVSATLKNFRILELQWGEVSWRRQLISPIEQFENGHLAISTSPGFGVTLNERLLKKYRL